MGDDRFGFFFLEMIFRLFARARTQDSIITFNHIRNSLKYTKTRLECGVSIAIFLVFHIKTLYSFQFNQYII